MLHLRFTIDHSLSLASLVCMFQHSTFSIEVDCLNLCSSECLHLPFAMFNSWDFPCLHVLVPGLRVLCMYTRQHRTTRPWEPESRNQVLGRLHVCLPLPGPIAPDRRMRARRNPAATEPLVAHVTSPSTCRPRAIEYAARDFEFVPGIVFHLRFTIDYSLSLELFCTCVSQ